MTLKQLIEKEDWDGLKKNLDAMTNSQFRMAETNIRTILSSVSNALFWDAYLFLMKYRHQSFITCITSIRHLVKSGELDFSHESARELNVWLQEHSPESVHKIISMAIPLLTSEAQAEGLLHLFNRNADALCVPVLVRQDTPLAYYMMFKALKQADSLELIRKCIVFLVQKHDDLSFNMASILKSYFGIDDINISFSLRVEPYELSHMDQSFANFNHILNGRRPKL